MDSGQAFAGDVVQPQDGATGFDVGKLSQEWKTWLDDPQNKAALMQFGISLMQPVGLGQSALGHLGQAVGAGGEAANRLAKEQLNEEEATSKQGLRESQATAAEQRATTAQARLEGAGVRDELRRQQIENSRLNAQLSAETKLTTAYSKQKADHEFLNPGKPFPTFEQWKATNPQLVRHLQMGGAIEDVAPSKTPSAEPLNQGGVLRFNSPEEVRAAVSSGRLKKGDTFYDAQGNTREVP